MAKAILAAAVLFVCASVATAQPTLVDPDAFDFTIELGGGTMWFSWSLENGDSILRAAAEATTTGYVGLGFNPLDNGHINCDMIAGWKDAGGTDGVEDFWSNNYSKIEYDAVGSLQDVQVQESGGRTAIWFSRALLANATTEDNVIIPGLNKFVWAWDDQDVPDGGAKANEVPQHSTTNRGTLYVDLLTGASSSLRQPLKWHFAMMVVGWFGFLSLGTIAGSYFRSDPSWAFVHSIMQFVGVVVISAAAFVGSWIVQGLHFRSAHAIIGTILVGALFAEGLMGAAYLHRIRFLPLTKVQLIRRAHKFLGVTLVLGAAVNMILGLSLRSIQVSDARFQLWSTSLALVAIGVALVFFRGAFAERRVNGVDTSEDLEVLESLNPDVRVVRSARKLSSTRKATRQRNPSR